MPRHGKILKMLNFVDLCQSGLEVPFFPATDYLNQVDFFTKKTAIAGSLERSWAAAFDYFHTSDVDNVQRTGNQEGRR